MTHDPILIVDDNPMNLKLAKVLLSGEGYDVHTATDGGEALDMLRQFHPRLILMDIQLPGMDGLTLTKILKAEPATENIIVIALTAYAMSGDEERARSAGCDGYITKPIDTRTLPATIRTYLSGAPPREAEPLSALDRYKDVLAEARQSFLAEGLEITVQLLLAATAGIDIDRILRVCHTWAGTAGSLGFTEISRRARIIEDQLRLAHLEPGPAVAWTSKTADHREDLRRDLAMLLQLFHDGLKGLTHREPLPQAVTALLAGKTFGVVGFAPPEIRRITEVLEQAGASTQYCPAQPSNADLRLMDAVIVDGSWAPYGAQDGPGPIHRKPVLLIGPAESLLRSPAPQAAGCTDLLLLPWDADELVLRAYRLLANGTHRPVREPGLSRPRVLIVDDDPRIVQVVRASLEIFDVQCDVALDGTTALERARAAKPDVVVLDVKIPDLDGFGVLLALKRGERTSQIPVVMVTALDNEDAVLRGFGLGADDFIRKPFSPMELAARVIRLFPQVESGPFDQDFFPQGQPLAIQ